MRLKKISLSVFLLILILFLAFEVNATSVGTEVSSNLEIFPDDDDYVNVFLCGDRDVLDDEVEPGRISDGGDQLIERPAHYLFEGEQIKWEVLVLDFNGINKIDKVYATIGNNPMIGNTPEVNCIPKNNTNEDIDESCNVQIEDQVFTEFNAEIMAYYTCTLTIETADSMYGEYWASVEAKDTEGFVGKMDENEFWFFNPTISISVSDGEIIFDNLKAGRITYSNNLTISGGHDAGNLVWLDMFITGTNFYDRSSDISFCPDEGVLSLDRFSYYAKNGEYDTLSTSNADSKGYRPLNYGIGFNDPNIFYNYAEIIPKGLDSQIPYYTGNILKPGEDMTVNFKLDIPQSCMGDFDSGGIFFWAEAI